MIFLTATACPVSWSFAELHIVISEAVDCGMWRYRGLPDETESSHTNGLKICVPVRRQSLLVLEAWY